MKSGAQLITAERMRQVINEGYGIEHDDQWTRDELALAAASYAMPSNEQEIDLDQERGNVRGYIRILRSIFFPFAPKHWKPTPHDRVKELTKAGALIAAEIDRLQRIEKKR